MVISTPTRTPPRTGGLRIAVYGLVQGVGFRPFVYRTAVACGLRGDVRNVGGRVEVRVFGPDEALYRFLDLLVHDAPPHARVDRVETAPIAPGPGATAFQVLASTDTDGAGRDVPPDLATCPACLAELFDRADRRYRYPFVNCTDCGPRATIVADLPYDRARTTMSRFAMCPDCAAEYHDPADRRFHAEPIACPACGPRLCWRSGAGPPAYGEAALAAAVAAIRRGGLVAVKGIGGYQLVCDAANDVAVARLRAAKGRPRKPLAVMVPDVAAAGRLARLDETERALLASPARPIVLLRGRRERVLAEGVAPDLPDVGLFLPYSPLHHLLLAGAARPLVVTSGNRGDEPILIESGAALRVLGPLTDGVLDHDRPILSRYDDSVARVVAGVAVLVRRARGYAPGALSLPVPAPEPLLAVGAHLKQTSCVAVDDRAMLGPHTGDLADAETFAAFEDGVGRLSRLGGVAPRVVCHDPHPGYLSTRYAIERFPPHRRLAVQHHHAHVVATAAEHGVPEPFIGIAYDGLGFGDDGTLWGGEVLLATYSGYRRLGRFGRAPLPGGTGAVRRPARMALGYLFGAEDLGAARLGTGLALELGADLLGRLDPREVAVVRRMIQRGVNTPLASSAGRLFDALASLLGVADDSGYEGEAAIRLEAAAEGHHPAGALRWRLARRGGLCVYDPSVTLADALTRAATEPVGVVAARFHATLAEVTVAFAEMVRARAGTRRVCLGGGVFQNRRLAGAVLADLTTAGFEPYLGQRVPVNDGGISYGQAVVGAARLAGR
jgi:hydrogenase maturation protein HypF